MGKIYNNNPFGNGLEILVLVRLEKVNISNKYSKVKILGTLLCVVGALTMSIMQSISVPATEKEKEATPTVQSSSSSTPSDFFFDMQKIIGCLFLMASVLILSSNIVLQVYIACNQIRKRKQIYINFVTILNKKIIFLLFLLFFAGFCSWRFSCTNVLECNNVLVWRVYDCSCSVT